MSFSLLLGAAFGLFLYMTILGLLWVDSLVLPGFLGTLVCIGLWVWTSGREQDDAVRSMRVDDDERRAA